MTKKDKAQTFSIMRKPIKVDGEDVRIYRRSCITGYSALLVPMVHLIHGIFSYEMTAVATALFKGDGSMRISQKSLLAKHNIGKEPNITRKQ